MTDKELWDQMDKLASEKESIERDMSFMLLLKTAYDQNLKLIISCFDDPEMPGMARQGYMEVMGKRMLVCFTSKQRAMQAKYNSDWGMADTVVLMNNMFNKETIAGMVFNPNDEKMVIVLKNLLLHIMLGDKPEPEFYKE